MKKMKTRVTHVWQPQNGAYSFNCIESGERHTLLPWDEAASLADLCCTEREYRPALWLRHSRCHHWRLQ